MVPLKNAWIVSFPSFPPSPPLTPTSMGKNESESGGMQWKLTTLQSGASEWTTDEREAFANDIEGPQLWAVTGTVNSEKSDKSPDEWKPELKSIHCKYAAAWIAVKSGYELTASSAEVSALEEMLGEC